jgi:hypothetical protein
MNSIFYINGELFIKDASSFCSFCAINSKAYCICLIDMEKCRKIYGRVTCIYKEMII